MNGGPGLYGAVPVFRLARPRRASRAVVYLGWARVAAGRPVCAAVHTPDVAVTARTGGRPDRRPRRLAGGTGHCAGPHRMDCHFESICESSTFLRDHHRIPAHPSTPDAVTR